MSTAKSVATEYVSGLRLPVLQEDIDYAIPANQYNCAVVRAIQRRFPTALRVVVNSKNIAFTIPEDDMRYRYKTPPVVVDKIIKPLDQFKTPQPMVVTLKNGEARLCDHDSQQRQTRRIAERDRMRARGPEARQQWGSVKVNKARREAHLPGYQRFCPDK